MGGKHGGEHSQNESTRAMPSCKAFTVDFLQKAEENEGEVPQYYVENSHPAIIDPPSGNWCSGSWSAGKPSGAATAVTASFLRLVCGDCGGYFGSSLAFTDKYRRTIWRCNSVHRRKVPDTAPDRGGDQGSVPGRLQCAGSGQRAAAGRVPHHAGGAHRYRLLDSEIAALLSKWRWWPS
ncbi:MAG: hypothetical protein ACLSB9_36415 [Hydrogeniiclostridium mannosilyticum]